jgi:hypothetical protein
MSAMQATPELKSAEAAESGGRSLLLWHLMHEKPQLRCDQVKDDSTQDRADHHGHT